MSDLHNYQSNDPQANRFGLGDHLGGHERVMNDRVMNDNDNAMMESTPVFEDTGGLSDVHRSEAEWEEPGSKRSKIVSALVVALLVGAAGAYTYANWTSAPKQAVPDSSLPKTAAINPAPAPQSAPDTTAMPSDNAAAPAATPAAAPEATTPKTSKPATTQTRAASRTPQSMSAPAPIVPSPSVMPPENQAATTPAPSEVTPQTQAAVAPEPASPAPPASAQTANPAQGEQSAGEQSAPASDVTLAPVTQPQPEGPAPAQPDGQPVPAAPQQPQ
jgi:hypothetical protein